MAAHEAGASAPSWPGPGNESGGRVRIQTDLVNERSQAAIARLGAVREGVLRGDRRRADGSFRDTVGFSILREEWPAVRARLEDGLAVPRG